MTRKIIFFGIIIIIILSTFFTALSWMSSWLSLIIGILFVIVLGNPYEHKTGNLTKILIKISVVCIGFGYPISAITELSQSSFYFVFFFIIATVILGYLLTIFFSIDKKIGDMISSGTAICGASAIAAIASPLRANDKQISVALGTVFILSASGLIFFPIIGNYLNLSQEQFGVWAGLTIHDTASAIGAALDFDISFKNEETEKITTIIKLAKVIFIVPLVFLGSLLYKKSNEKVSFPYFILFFILAMFLNSSFPTNEGFSILKNAGKKGLQICLFLIGTNLSVNNLKTIGIKPFLHGLILWVTVSISSLLAIIHFIK